MTAAHEQFRQALRGYDQTEVDRRISELVANEQSGRGEAAALAARVQELERAQQEATRAVEAAQSSSTPTYEDLGARIAQMLSLADEEANELRTSAKGDADALHESSHQA